MVVMCINTKPRHTPGLFRFRLHHIHCSELGVLLEPDLIAPRIGEDSGCLTCPISQTPGFLYSRG